MEELPQDFELVKEAAKKNELDQHYEAWKADSSPENLGIVLKAAQPVISSASKTYGGGVDIGSKTKLLTIKALSSYDKNRNASLSSHIYNQLQPLRREATRRSNFRLL